MKSPGTYSKFLADYKRALCSCDIPLYEYCLMYRISYNSVQAWMRAQNMTLNDFEPASCNEENFDSISCPLEESESSYHIYPLSFQTSPVEEKIICEQTSSSIKGVKIKFPNGTELSIDDVMAKDLAALLLSCNTGY
ncbi:MAG: hypothetical protein PHH63_08505 [Bacteroidales bacterium]|jgi:hypothetical protein|nr:hypothetical protein [Bacteroidales bacterium]